MTADPSNGRDAAAASLARASAAPPEGVPGSRRALLADAVLVAGYLLVAVFLIVLSLEPPHVTPLWPMILITVAGTVVLAIRRRALSVALAAALVLIPVSLLVGTGAEVILLGPLLYRAGLARRAGVAWLWCAASLASAAAGGVALAHRLQVGPPILGLTPRVQSDAFTDALSLFVPVAGGVLVSTLIGINVGHRRRLVAALVERADQMKRERDQQASIARAAERERIAREMHDVIAHSLAVMIALSDGARAAAPRRPEEAELAVARIGELGRRTLGEVRRLLATVRDDAPTPEHPQPGVEQLPALVEEFRAAGLPVRLESSGRPGGDPVVGFTVYRIVQESLTNVLRHARNVRDVQVRLETDDAGITVLVQDASDPAEVAGDPGRGLVGIRERAAFYDGAVETGPRPGGGWRVFVRLPTGDTEGEQG